VGGRLTLLDGKMTKVKGGTGQKYDAHPSNLIIHFPDSSFSTCISARAAPLSLALCCGSRLRGARACFRSCFGGPGLLGGLGFGFRMTAGPGGTRHPRKDAALPYPFLLTHASPPQPTPQPTPQAPARLSPLGPCCCRCCRPEALAPSPNPSQGPASLDRLTD
jgi:hypothetical protein